MRCSPLLTPLSFQTIRRQERGANYLGFCQQRGNRAVLLAARHARQAPCAGGNAHAFLCCNWSTWGCSWGGWRPAALLTSVRAGSYLCACWHLPLCVLRYLCACWQGQKAGVGLGLRASSIQHPLCTHTARSSIQHPLCIHIARSSIQHPLCTHIARSSTQHPLCTQIGHGYGRRHAVHRLRMDVGMLACVCVCVRACVRAYVYARVLAVCSVAPMPPTFCSLLCALHSARASHAASAPWPATHRACHGRHTPGTPTMRTTPTFRSPPCYPRSPPVCCPLWPPLPPLWRHPPPPSPSSSLPTSRPRCRQTSAGPAPRPCLPEAALAPAHW